MYDPFEIKILKKSRLPSQHSGRYHSALRFGDWILPCRNLQFCLRLPISDLDWHSSSREPCRFTKCNPTLNWATFFAIHQPVHPSSGISDKCLWYTQPKLGERVNWAPILWAHIRHTSLTRITYSQLHPSKGICEAKFHTVTEVGSFLLSKSSMLFRNQLIVLTKILYRGYLH